MYTQLHVDTPAGRIVSHRLADEVSALQPGEDVTLSWAPDHASALEAAGTSEPPLGDSSPDLRGDDHDQRDDITTTATAITSGSRHGKRSAL